MKNIFESVYPFTTEDISKYFPLLDLKDKNVLTVGSSGDQAFNALLLDAGKVTLYDISPNTYEFVKLKKDIILEYPRKKAYKKIIKIEEVPLSKDKFSYQDLVKMNPYFKDDASYEKLRDKLKSEEIDFIIGDIFKMNDYLDNEKYDRIIFSNILQYIDYFARMNGYDGRKKDFLKENFNEWLTHLEDNGLIQLMYLYSTRGQNNEMIDLCDALEGYPIIRYRFNNTNNQGESAVLAYRKK